jgi:hypothetical protein
MIKYMTITTESHFIIYDFRIGWWIWMLGGI